MEVLGVGPMELLFILIIALIVLGPNDMTKAGHTIGRFLRKLVMSPTWIATQQIMRNLRQLPTLLIREAGIEEELNGLRATQEELKREVEAFRNAKASLHAAVQSATTAPTAAPKAEAEAPEELTHTIHNDLGSWTRPPSADAGTPNKQADSEPPKTSTDQ